MRQRIISLLLAVTIVCSLFVGLAPQAQALHLWIKDRSAVSGSDYTESDKMAQKLDEIFDGSLSVYSNSGCTTPVSAPIGSSVMKNNGVAMYVGPYGGKLVNSGTSCWIYAQGVYYTLFEDYVYNNVGRTGNSENIDMSTTATTNCTYENFKAWGVRQGVGAMLRAAGHSMILLDYNEEKMITLEGNADGAGLVCIRERSWDILKNKYTSFAFIVQPTDAYMQENYDACRHENMSGLGLCPDCGYQFNWQRTLDQSTAGYYSIQATCTPKTAPYASAESTASLLATGELAQVQGSVTNYFGEAWYQLLLEDGTAAYAPAELLKFSGVLPLEVVCTGFKPADGLALPAASYPLGGTVTSNYPLKRIDAYLDDVWYAAWKASNSSTTKLTLGATDINMDLAFSKLAKGKHVIKLIATDYEHAAAVTFHTSCFYIVGSGECRHTYSDEVTTSPTCTEAGVRTYTCSQCGDSYTEAVAAQGHLYSNGYCTVCGSLDFDYTFTTASLQVGTVEAQPGQQVSVPVRISNNQCFAKFSFTVNYNTSAMTLTGASAGPLLENGSFTYSGGTVNWSSDSNTVGDGTVFYLNFALKDTTPIGSYDVSVALKSNSTWYFRDENDYARDLEILAGTVKCVEQLPVTVWADGSEQGGYSTLEQAAQSYDSESQYLKLHKDLTVTLTLNQDLYIDLNGFNLTGTVQTAGYKLYGMDSSTDSYTCDQLGYFNCTENGVSVQPQAFVRREQKRYAALETSEGYSFHRFYLGITYATVKPSSQGVGYKALFMADDMLTQHVDSCGFILQLGDNRPVQVSQTDFISGQTVTLRVENYNVDRHGETALNAQAFLTVDGISVESAACSYSLRQIVEKLNENAENLNETQKAALAVWIANTPIMQSWSVENLWN